MQALAAPFKHVNFTSFTDDKCATLKAAKHFKVDECKGFAIYSCTVGGNGTVLVNVSSFNDDTCTSLNSSKLYDSGVCTETGPKTGRTSKLAVCTN